MRPLLVVDSSVAFKWFPAADEAGVAQALQLLERHRAEAITLCAPTLMRLEVLNGYWKRGASADELDDIARVLDDFGLVWFEIDGDLAAHAGRLAADTGLSVYDATFAALAMRLDTELVTCDARLLGANACQTRTLGQPIR